MILFYLDKNLFNLVDQGSADVLAECAKRGIAFVPFCPLGLPGPARSHLLASPVLGALGARLHATPAQIALAWLLGLAPNILLIPGTRTRVHLAENLAVAARSREDYRDMTLADVERNAETLPWGTAAEVRDRIIEAAEHSGAGTVQLSFNRGAMPHAMFVEQIRRFAKDVLPALQAHKITAVPLASEAVA